MHIHENLLWKIIELALRRLSNCRAKIQLNFNIGLATYKPKIQKDKTMLELNITNEQMIEVTLNPTTLAGYPVEVQPGSITWQKDSGDATFTPSDDGRTCNLISQDIPGAGDSVFKVSADADLGEGVQTITGFITLHVLGANAANLGLVAGEAQLKPNVAKK